MSVIDLDQNGECLLMLRGKVYRAVARQTETRVFRGIGKTRDIVTFQFDILGETKLTDVQQQTIAAVFAEVAPGLRAMTLD